MAKRPTKHPAVQLAEALVKYGIDEGVSALYARGIIATLKDWCWTNLTDVVGNATDVDAAAGSPTLPVAALANVMVRCKLLGVSKGEYYMPSAYTERPFTTDKQWRRKERVSWEAAKERAKAFKFVKIPPKVQAVDAGSTDLFGDPLPVEPEPKPAPEPKKKPKPKQSGVPGYKEIVAYWCEQWTKHAGNAVAKYPFGSIDGRNIKNLLAKTESIEHAKAVIDAYMLNGDRFYGGKGTKQFIGNLSRWVSEASGGNARRANELPNERDDPLPRRTRGHVGRPDAAASTAFG